MYGHSKNFRSELVVWYECHSFRINGELNVTGYSYTVSNSYLHAIIMESSWTVPASQSLNYTTCRGCSNTICIFYSHTEHITCYHTQLQGPRLRGTQAVYPPSRYSRMWKIRTHVVGWPLITKGSYEISLIIFNCFKIWYEKYHHTTQHNTTL